jgi:hypothetical protein
MVAACTYCMGSKVSSLSQLDLYSTYSVSHDLFGHRYINKQLNGKQYISLGESLSTVGVTRAEKILQQNNLLK